MADTSTGPVYEISKNDLEDVKLYRLNRKFKLVYDQMSQIQDQLTALGKRVTALESPIAVWERPTGTVDRTTFATATVTLVDLAERVAAMIEDFIDDNVFRT